MNPGKTFRLKNTTKALMATITDDHSRGEFKRAMIQAQLQSEISAPRDKRPAGSFGAPQSNAQEVKS